MTRSASYSTKSSSLKNSDHLQRRNFFQDEENGISVLMHTIKKRIFTANHLMIQAFQMHQLIFFVILIIEYLQIIYFAFHDLKIKQMIDNGHEVGNDTQHDYILWNSQYNILRLLNYELLIIDDQNSDSQLKTYYIMTFIHLSIYLALILALLAIGRKKIMRSDQFNQEQKRKEKRKNGKSVLSTNLANNQSRSPAIQDGNDIEGKQKKNTNFPWQDQVVAIIVFVAQSLLVIPTIYLFSTIFNCDRLSKLYSQIQDNSQDNTTTSGFQCLSRDHIILMSVLSFLGLICVGFLAIEALIYQDLNMKSTLPWRQIPSRIDQLKLMQKLICALFNFNTLTEKPIALGILTFFTLIIIFKRFQFTRIYWKPYRNWVIFTELTVFWFAFWNFIQKVTGFDLNIYTFSFLIIGGAFPFYTVILYIFTHWKFERLVLRERHSIKEIGSDVQTETYFGYLLDLIKDSQYNEGSKILLYGLLRVHWYSCKKKQNGIECHCNTLIERMDVIEQSLENEYNSKQDQFDVIRIQKQMNQYEDEIIKMEDEDIKMQQEKMRQKSTSSQNMQKIINDIRLSSKHKNDNNKDQTPQSEKINDKIQDTTMNDGMLKDDNSQTQQNQNNTQALFINPTQTYTKNQNEDTAAKYQNNELEAQVKKSKQKQNLNRHIKILFYRFVYSLIEDALVQYKDSIRLKYLAAFIQYYLLQNEIKGLFEILMIEKRNKVPFEWQFFIYKVKIEIEDYMDLVHKQRSHQSGRIDVKKVYLFAKDLQDFENAIETISDKCLDFWKEQLKQSDFDANTLHKVGTEITMMNHQIVSLVNNMFDINPHHQHLLQTYSLFLLRVMNNEEDSEKYIRKLSYAKQNFSSYEAATLQEELLKNFSSNINYVIVVMRVSTKENGIVEDINHEVQRLLGYNRVEVIGKNIQMIMPKCIGNLHDQFIQNYLDTAKPKILNKQREVFALKKNGYITQVFIYVTSVPMVEREGIKFVGFLKRVDEKKFTEILPPPMEISNKPITILAAPNGNIYGLNESALKMLGFPKYFTEESDDKTSDYNIKEMFKSEPHQYSKVLYECFKQSPTPQIATIDTEQLQAFLVPDLHTHQDYTNIKKRFGKYQVYIQAQPIDYGYKGGAYLPMIVFRFYIHAKMETTKSKRQLIKPVHHGKVKKQMTTFAKGNYSLISLDRKQQKSVINRSKPLITAEFGQAINVQDVDKNDSQDPNNENYEEVSEEDSDSSRGQEDKVDQDWQKQVEIEKKKELDKFIESSASSMSASNDGKTTDITRLREFRKMVNSRKEPQIVIFLRRFVLIITFIIMSIISINTGFKINFYSNYQNYNQLSDTLSIIQMDLFHIHSGFRTLINIQNNIQSDQINGLTNKNEFSSLIRANLNDYINSLNKNKNEFYSIEHLMESTLEPIVSHVSIKQILADTTVDYQTGDLNLALGQIISKGNFLLQQCQLTQKPFLNMTFINYINKVLNNQTKSTNTYYQYPKGKYGNSVDQVTKDLYFIQENIYEGLTEIVEGILQKIEDEKVKYIDYQQTIFLVLISAILCITIISIGLIFQIVRQIHKMRIQSLSLYSELNIDDIQEIIQDLNKFLEVIRDDTDILTKHIQRENDDSDGEEPEIVFQDAYDEQEEGNDEPTYSPMRQRMLLKSTQELIHHHKLSNLSENGEPLKLDSVRVEFQANKGRKSQVHKPQAISFLHKNNMIPGTYQEATIKKPSFTKRISDYEQSDTVMKLGYQADSIEIEDVNSSRNGVLDPDMSQRELNPQNSLTREHQSKSNHQNPQQHVESEDNNKVGNKEKFKMVKSKSGIKVISTVIMLFIFVIMLVISNFALFIPMFKNFQTSHQHEALLLKQFRFYYKIYIQVVKDLVNGESEYQNSPLVSNYKMLIQDKFDNYEKILQIIQDHSAYLDNTVELVQSLHSSSYCDRLSYSQNERPFNLTFCQTIDNGVARQQGYYIQIERMMGEINKIRLEFEQKPVNYNNLYKLLDKDQTLSRFQLMMDKLFTPTFHAIRLSILSNLQQKLKLNQSVEISILSIFIAVQILVVAIAWPRFLRIMNNQISKSRGILTLIPSRLILNNNNIKQIIEQNKLLTQ